MALGEGGDHGAAAPLIADHAKHAGSIVRSGSMWTAAAHVITAVIGSGVLSLAWSIAQLGWVAGPAAMLVFAAVTAVQSTLFADCYRSPDPEHGPHRNRTYANAVGRNLGISSSWVCLLLQHTALFGYGIAYTITASISSRVCLTGSELEECVTEKLATESSFLELRTGGLASQKGSSKSATPSSAF